MLPRSCVIFVAALGKNMKCAQTSQSPAVREMLVMLAGVPVVSETADPLAIIDWINSPTLPAFAPTVIFCRAPG